MSSHNADRDLVVIGGGVIGLAVSRACALRGHQVTVLERSTPGRGASWAAAGMLSPLGEARDRGPFFDLALESLRVYRPWAEAVESESGISFDYCEGGKVHVARSQHESTELRRKLDWAQQEGLRVEWLDRGRLREEESALTESAEAGLLVRDDFRVDNRRLVEALVESCLRAGVTLRAGVEVRSIRISRRRVVEVELFSGERIKESRVVVAAGAWSGRLEGLPAIPRVRPIRGQMIALAPSHLPSSRVLESEDVYLVPRGDGRLLVGATVEDVGFEKANTAEAIRGLLAHALELVAGLGRAPIVEMWSGLRPGTEDGLPIIGADPEIGGLFYATGHFRNGILLTPLTAQMVADWASGEVGLPIPREFSPGRSR